MTPTDPTAVLGADYTIGNVSTMGGFIGGHELFFNAVMFTLAGSYVLGMFKILKRARPRV